MVDRYREAHRRYHGFAHVRHVVTRVDELLEAWPQRDRPEPAIDPSAVRLAAWFHDVIYDPTSSTNEEASARFAAETLGRLGTDSERIEAVTRLVRVTEHHVVERPDEMLLVDADLAVLGTEHEVYDRYVEGVRAEYAHVDDTMWRAGRPLVLRRLLEKERIFTTPGAIALESAARANLTRELARYHH